MKRYKLDIACEDRDGGSWNPPDVEIDAENMEKAEDAAVEAALEEMEPCENGFYASEVRVTIYRLTDVDDGESSREVEVRGTVNNPDVTIW